MIDFLAGLIPLLAELFFVVAGRWVLKLFGEGEPHYGEALAMGLVVWGLVVVLAFIMQM
ncbi:hypothetical protein [Bradyrhizobium commune]|uniref:Uncharacterized protein n=1 Tax=Bradyrhizobium commune TaxID=83627 RepID=A0A7S9DCC0_9BRAD|nr:hypothetical protein [Bradyrhizobium commune]QPF95013.1 hypothetical protein IC761_17810 [Bradyrhizobium commune]